MHWASRNQRLKLGKTTFPQFFSSSFISLLCTTITTAFSSSLPQPTTRWSSLYHQEHRQPLFSFGHASLPLLFLLQNSSKCRILFACKWQNATNMGRAKPFPAQPRRVGWVQPNQCKKKKKKKREMPGLLGCSWPNQPCWVRPIWLGWAVPRPYNNNNNKKNIR